MAWGDGDGKDRDLLSVKSVKLPTRVEIKNSKMQKFENFPILQLPRKWFVAQTLSWASSLRIDAKYRAYGAKSAIFTPQWERTRQGRSRLACSRQGSTWF